MIVTLITSVDRVRTPLPNVTAFQDGRTNFVLLKKFALHRISSAIGRWHHNCNSRDQLGAIQVLRNADGGGGVSGFLEKTVTKV